MKALAYKQFLFLLGFTLCFIFKCAAQDTLLLKKGTTVLCKILVIKPEYLYYSSLDTNDKAIYSIARNKIKYITNAQLEQKQKKQEVDAFEVNGKDSLKSKDKTLTLGFAAIVVSCQPLVYLRYKLNSKNNLWLSGGYIFKGYCTQNSLFSFVNFAGINKFSGPDLQFGLTKKMSYGRGKFHSLNCINILYDLRIKKVPKHIWFEGSPGIGQDMQQIRSEHIFSHNLILIFSKSFALASELNLALFAGGGIQLNQIKAHLYSYGYSSYAEEGNYPENTFKKEAKLDVCVRFGACLSYDFFRRVATN